uniref:1-phosphatidylinositol 4,5-bisphosphate phosphodiesterase epsilon-1 n=1 Tax=Culex pipiens TaxID=7175 RepID=A0A8D8DQH2_CULPI
MREAFPGLPFNSNVAAEKLLLSTLSAPLDQTVQLKEQKVSNKLRHSTVSPLTVSLSSSSLSSNATVASNSAATSHKHGPGIVITEKIINNSQGETIEEALVDTESEKNVVLDSHSAQSNVGNLPSTVVQAGTAVATTTTTSNAGTSSTTPSFGELDELHSILHFPEEVALRITDTEYHLFYQVLPNDFINDAILELQKEQTFKTSNQNHTSLSTTSVSCSNNNVSRTQEPKDSSSVNGIGTADSTAITADTHSEYQSSLSSIRKRFEETSAWTNYFVLSQGTQDERKAAFACLLRVAISCWNIGNFNGAKEIVDGLKSIKRESIWSSEAERARNSAFEFLTNVFDSNEYENALSRALAISTCRTVPYFKNHINELKKLLRAVPESLHDGDDDDVQCQQDRYYLGETKQILREDDEEMLLRLSQVELPLQHPETSTSSESPTVDNLEQTIYQRVQPAFKTILACVSHHQSLCRELPHSLQEFLRTAANSPRQTKIPLYQPSNLQELEEDYEVEIGNYNPVQPLFYDHGVSIVPLSTKKSNVVDHHILQILHHGTTAVLWEPEIPAERSTFVYLRLERSCSCISWQRTAWRRIKSQQDINPNQNPEENVTWRFASRCTSNIGDVEVQSQNLEEGILDLGTVKDIAMGSRNHEYDHDILAAGKRFGLTHVESCISLLYGNSASENRFLCILCPPLLCRTWFIGLHWMLRGFRRQQSLIDRSMLWLKELYIQLYYEEGMCSEPTVSDAIKAFGGQLYLSSMKSLSRTQINDSTQELVATTTAATANKKDCNSKIRKKRSMANLLNQSTVHNSSSSATDPCISDLEKFRLNDKKKRSLRLTGPALSEHEKTQHWISNAGYPTGFSQFCYTVQIF